MAESNLIPILVALSLTGGLIAFADGWRLPLLALSAQYVLVGVLLSKVVPRDLALVKVVVGGLICAILLITKHQRIPWSGLIRRQIATLTHLTRQRAVEDTVILTSARDQEKRPNPAPQSPGRRLLDLSLSVLLLLTLALASITLAGLWQQRSPVPTPAATGLAATWMMGVGLLSLASRWRPFHTGLGLLTLILGFETAYTPLEPSLIMAGLLGVLNIVTSLAVASIETIVPPLESNP